MKMVCVTTLLALVVAVSARKERDEEKCVACYRLAEHVKNKLADTEGRANEEISIGVRLGADGETKPKTVVRYGDSDNRLLDIMEGACDSNEKKARCHELIHEQEDNIASWFHDSRNVDFNKQICDSRITGCNADIVARLKSKGSDVEVEDDSSSKAAGTTKKETFKKEESKKQQVPKKEESKKETTLAFDPLAIIQKITGRMKNNALRAKSLSIELYGELNQIVRARNWAKLGAMLKDGKFYQKYYLVFIAAFFVFYMIFSLYDALFGKAQVKNARPRPTGSRRKTGTKGKKDE